MVGDDGISERIGAFCSMAMARDRRSRPERLARLILERESA